MQIISKRFFAAFGLLTLAFNTLTAQEQDHAVLDSLYIQEVEGKKGSDKVLHAEPLYIDLIRDLGARKGEKEWNVGLGMTDNSTYDLYSGLVEYEWAPIDRLGLEVEIPFSFYFPTQENAEAPGSLMNGLKLAVQQSFYVSEKRKTSMALGYIHEFKMIEFRQYGTKDLISGQLFNPFFIVAKRWGNNFHSLLYTGPAYYKAFGSHKAVYTYQMNLNIHYMISGTRNFIGLEMNQVSSRDNYSLVFRPQIRVGLAENMMIGIVTGIPVSKQNERLSTFLRLIYEPGHAKQGNKVG